MSPTAMGSFYKNRPWTPQKFFIHGQLVFRGFKHRAPLLSFCFFLNFFFSCPFVSFVAKTRIDNQIKYLTP